MPKFTPPVDNYGNDGLQEPLWVWFVHFDRGLSVLGTGGVYETVPFPTTDQIDAADAVYLGGHIYDIDEAEAEALVAAGYGDCITSTNVWGLLNDSRTTWGVLKTWGSP